MAECVVDLLELIQIHNQHRQPGLISADVFHCIFEAVFKNGARGEPSEGIVLREMAEHLLALAELICLRSTRFLRITTQPRTHERGGERQSEHYQGMSRGPPGWPLQKGYVGGRAQEDPERFGHCHAGAYIVLDIDADRADPGDAQPAPDSPGANSFPARLLGRIAGKRVSPEES